MMQRLPWVLTLNRVVLALANVAVVMGFVPMR